MALCVYFLLIAFFNCEAPLWWYHPYSCMRKGRKGITLLSQDHKEIIFTCFQRYKKQRRKNLFRLRLFFEITPWGIWVPSTSSSWAGGCAHLPRCVKLSQFHFSAVRMGKQITETHGKVGPMTCCLMVLWHHPIDFIEIKVPSEICPQ